MTGIWSEPLKLDRRVHGLSKRHRVGRNLIRIWLTKYQDGEFNDEVAVADSLEAYQARIAAHERKVGQFTMEKLRILAAEVLLHHLSFEFDAVGSLTSHLSSSMYSAPVLSTQSTPPVQSMGFTPISVHAKMPDGLFNMPAISRLFKCDLSRSNHGDCSL